MRAKWVVSLVAAGAVIAIGMSGSVAEAKGGHGHGFSRGHGHFMTSHARFVGSPPGWSRGRKVGWRGHGCPPGLWKKGFC